MKKIISALGVLLILFIIINIPFEDKPKFKLEDDVLVFYSQGLGIAGVRDIEILNNGSIVDVKTYINKPWEFKEVNRLNRDELSKLKSAINNNQFSVSKISLLDKWKRKLPNCVDCDTSISIFINKNNKTIKIKPDGVIWDIVSGIRV